ncbi:MAG: uroporphyrinogen decarboxylase family protein [Clostridia bacterium]|nr:uroporphyrinogen decarboxylase family protein [Clostridia bacterium]
MNMKKWLADIIAADKKTALPILSFPAARELGLDINSVVDSAELQAECMAKIAEKYKMAAAVTPMDLSVEAECFGAKLRRSAKDVPAVHEGVIDDIEDAEDIIVPEIGTGRTGIFIDALRIAKEKIADRPVFAGVIGPYSLAGRLMDFTEIMYACYDEPESVHVLLEKATDFIVDYIAAFKNAGADGVILAEPLAGLLSPALADEFSCGYVKKIAEACQSDDFIIIYHNCGNAAGLMIKEIAQTGCAAYHFGNAVDVKAAIEFIPADAPCMGNIDPAGEFKNGTPESIKKATIELMESMKAYPNFIISSGCDIPMAAKDENIQAFFDAVEEFYK